MGVTAGIEGRSWSAFFGPASIGLFLAVLALSIGAMGSKHSGLRVTGLFVSLACLVVFAGAILNVGERLYLVNGKTYPHFLARNIGAASHATLDRLQLADCKGTGMEIYGKADHEWVIRCGFSWFGGHTYLSSTDPFGGMLGSQR